MWDRGQFDLSDCGHLNCPLSVILADLQNGARSVNLIAGDKPADVYSGIAARWRPLLLFNCFGMSQIFSFSLIEEVDISYAWNLLLVSKTLPRRLWKCEAKRYFIPQGSKDHGERCATKSRNKQNCKECKIVTSWGTWLMSLLFSALFTFQNLISLHTYIYYLSFSAKISSVCAD